MKFLQTAEARNKAAEIACREAAVEQRVVLITGTDFWYEVFYSYFLRTVKMYADDNFFAFKINPYRVEFKSGGAIVLLDLASDAEEIAALPGVDLIMLIHPDMDKIAEPIKQLLKPLSNRSGDCKFSVVGQAND